MTTRCLYVRVNVGIQTIVYIFKARCSIVSVFVLFAENLYWRGKLNTVDRLEQLILKLKILFAFVAKQAALKRSTVLSLPILLVFPASSLLIYTDAIAEWYYAESIRLSVIMLYVVMTNVAASNKTLLTIH